MLAVVESQISVYGCRLRANLQMFPQILIYGLDPERNGIWELSQRLPGLGNSIMAMRDAESPYSRLLCRVRIDQRWSSYPQGMRARETQRKGPNRHGGIEGHQAINSLLDFPQNGHSEMKEAHFMARTVYYALCVCVYVCLSEQSPRRWFPDVHRCNLEIQRK